MIFIALLASAQVPPTASQDPVRVSSQATVKARILSGGRGNKDALTTHPEKRVIYRKVTQADGRKSTLIIFEFE